VTVCHLGDLGHVPSQEQVEQFSDVDVLLIPVGGRSTLAGSRAAEAVNLIEPRIVIPMHYKIPGLAVNLEGPTRFLREMAVETPEPLDSLKVTTSEWTESVRVVLLDPKH
jgi:L-ascorbate metabolism protein UlaG (beta-lactamase superfamily)